MWNEDKDEWVEIVASEVRSANLFLTGYLCFVPRSQDVSLPLAKVGSRVRIPTGVLREFFCSHSVCYTMGHCGQSLAWAILKIINHCTRRSLHPAAAPPSASSPDTAASPVEPCIECNVSLTYRHIAK